MKIAFRANCGCKWTEKSSGINAPIVYRLALRHAETTGHTVEVRGEIRGERKPKPEPIPGKDGGQ